MTRTKRIQNGTLMATALSLLLAGGHAIANDDPKTHADHAGDSDQPVDDTWITTKVKSSLLADSDVAGLDVSVETVNGVVRLSGDVESQAQIDRAVEIARDIEGVTNVESSDLTVVVGTDY